MHGAMGMHSPLSAASCCGNRSALSPWPRTHECTCNMACLRVTITRHESNKVSITLVGISCAIAGCPFPSVGDNAQTVKHFFRWCCCFGLKSPRPKWKSLPKMAFAPQSQGRPTPSPISPIGQRPKPPNKGPLGDLSFFYSNKKTEDQKDDQ